MQEISTKPYLLRALYEWCTDNGFTPHIAVRVDNSTRVPRQFVRNDEIVLNISFEATSQLQMGNEWIEFSARFSGKSHKIEVQVAKVLAIYARENGQGMAFPVEPASADAASASRPFQHEPLQLDESEHEAAEPARASRQDEPASSAEDDASKSSGRTHLKVVK
ncbi:ClpXP protease specificity-enhancing factor / Stringent starvation protein B [Candidatus Burkholderia verschuerenii]|uniref:ClpXP protease specificity-enhancing factor / Stringent starvation protein B n=1 Tax=Candidatus Burkholderia verschuerenii TaxID=242163 RepID=A0A0L0M918_9BURK|nr:ClpXP protease specificity-enhancing factor [Candidatus Burkholderia verschuerenii]KND58800.1 ClpXP protease specificity-enhancing factor / Stringent starvation protein B [Candidatus Burkholderia verschuerenii]